MIFLLTMAIVAGAISIWNSYQALLGLERMEQQIRELRLSMVACFDEHERIRHKS